MTPGCLNVFGIEESRPSLPTELCSPVPRRHPCEHTRTHMHVSFRKAVQSSPAWRNAGETEVTEFPSLSCHLLATGGWLLEVAWAGKGSERGSGLLLLAQEQSQQLQSCCEVMPGAAGVFLQAETDSGRVGWQPQPWRACREITRTLCLYPNLSLPDLGGLQSDGHLYPELSCSLGRAFHREHWRLGLASPGLSAPLPRCCGPAETGSEAPERNQLELEPGTQPQLPRPSPALVQLHQGSH